MHVSPSVTADLSSQIPSLQSIISDNNRTLPQYVHPHPISFSKCRVCSNSSCPCPMHILAEVFLKKCFVCMISTPSTLQFSFALKQKKKCHHQQRFWKVDPTLPKQDPNRIKEMPLTVTDGEQGQKSWSAPPLPCLVTSHLPLSPPRVHSWYPDLPTRLSQTELLLTGHSKQRA